jgi:hypothetical protein
MIHNYIGDTGAHYAVGNNGAGAVILQVQDVRGMRAQIALTPELARHLAGCLWTYAGTIVYQQRYPRQEEADFANAGAAYTDAEGGL